VLCLEFTSNANTIDLDMIAMMEDYVPPAPIELLLAGASGAVVLRAAVDAMHRRKLATDHDLVVAAALADTLCGGAADPTVPVNEAALLGLERANFDRLLRSEKTQGGIGHALSTGKPLRN